MVEASHSEVDSASSAGAAAPVVAATQPSLARQVLGGVVAAAIALAGFLPPLVHFVTGPFGPALGAFFVAQRLRPDARGCAVIALTVGASFALVAGGASAAIANLSGPSGPPDWFPPSETLALIVGGVALYATALAALGATIGARGRS